MTAPSYVEEISSHIPALHLLTGLGYAYIPPAEALTLHSGAESPVVEAISQMIRNQDADEIPGLFLYSQLLLAVSKNDALYATTGTPRKFWSIWREEGDSSSVRRSRKHDCGGQATHRL